MKLIAKIMMSFVFTLALASGSAYADEWLRSMPEFELADHLGKVHSSEDYKQYDLAVLYVQGVGCPIARLAVPAFREVRTQFAAANIQFTMFNANIQDDMARIAHEAEEFMIDFPILKDDDQRLAKALGVERTAEVFVIDTQTREVLFRGPINDQLGYETQRNQAEDEYLKDALETILAGGTVNIDSVPDSKGCLVAIF